MRFLSSLRRFKLVAGSHSLRAGGLLLGLLAGASAMQAQVSYDTAGSTYTQGFATAGLSLASHAWTNNSTYLGWYAASYNNTASTWATPGSFYASNGVNDGSTDFVWYRTGASATSLTLGTQVTDGKSPGGGAAGAYYGVQFANNTGATLDSFTVSYQVEMWRRGPSASLAQTTLVAAYRVTNAGASFNEINGWTLIDGSSYTTPKAGSGSSSSSISGKDSANIVNFTDLTVSGLSVADGQSLWIRWFDANSSGTDHGIGIDNISFSATAVAVPEPGTTAALIGAGILGFVLLRRRQR